MTNRANTLLLTFVRPIAVGLLYYGLAYLSLSNAMGAEGTATIWPSSGVLLAALMLSRRRDWGAILFACAVASVLANNHAGTEFWLACGFTVANLVEGALAIRLQGKSSRNYSDFSNPYQVGRFTIAAVIAGIISASLATVFAGEWTGALFISWSTTVIFGMLIVAPLIITIAYYATLGRRLITIRGIARGLFILSFVAAITALVFTQSTYPLLFLPLAAMLMATYLFGPPGAAASVFIILVIGLVATNYGQGPIQFVEGSTEVKVLFFQFYLAIGLLSSFPLAALLAQRAKNLIDLKNSNRMLEMAERAANVGHWRMDLEAGDLVWSAEIYRIHGRDPSTKLQVDRAIEEYHPDDRKLVEDELNKTINTGEPFKYEARLLRANGEIRYVLSSGEIECDPITGEFCAVFGMMMDITDKVISLKQLEEAREQAELEALHAAKLAETDQLTGIANRRKILGALRSEIARAEAYGSDLTIAVLDVDHFKVINDTFGHAAGDDVLIALAKAFTGALRPGDSLGRVGGEEFVVILPGTDEATGVPVVERLRNCIAELEWPGMSLDQVTASIGLASHRSGQDERALMRAADRALYQAKADGRNVLRVAA